MLAFALMTLPDRVELRPTQAKALASFPSVATGPARRLFVNGKPTTVVVPAGYDVDVRCHDANGRAGGAIMWSELADPMYFVVEGQGFLTEPGDRVRLIPVWPRELDGKGRALGLTGSINPGEEDHPGHGWLWDGRRAIDLGPAEKVRFGRADTVEGYCATDAAGKPVNLYVARVAYLEEGQERYRPFVWWNGARTDDALLKKPPF